MINPEYDRMTSKEYPFLHTKIPVADGLEGFTHFVEQYTAVSLAGRIPGAAPSLFAVFKQLVARAS